jgi:hypothetical protein
LTGSVKLSGDSCNGLKAGSDGKLYALCPKGNAGSSAIQTSPQGSGLPQAVVNGGNYTYLNDNSASSIHICNNSCNLLEGVVTVNVGDCYFVGHPGFIGSAHLEVNINSGGFNAIEPSTRQTFSVDSADAQNHYLDINQHADLFLSLASGDCVDYQFALVFNINTASGSTINTDSTGPKFVTRWVLIQDGGC